MATPKLRFKEFDEDLEKTNLINLTMWASGGTPSKKNEDYWMGDIPLISGASMHTRKICESEVNITDLGLKKGSKLAPKNSILILVRGSMLFKKIPIGMALKDVAFNQDVKSINTKEGLNEYYFFQWLLSQENIIQNKVTSTGIGAGKLDTSELQNLEIYYPAKSEQTKIATFLSAVDTKIDELIQKHELLTDYKKGMMQQIFSQKLRFKADDGSDFEDWDDITLGEIASKSLAKNKDESISEVLTNSATQGIIKQSDYFEREIVTTSNLKGYYVVEMDDFVYNPRISSQAPVGPIKRNKQCLGVMSPLYTVFTINKGDINYLEYFFESSVWHDYVKSVSNSGARHDRMNIKNQDFFDMPILYPCLAEQTKIANFLTAIDQKINNAADQIDQAKTWKKGLLQQMFV